MSFGRIISAFAVLLLYGDEKGLWSGECGACAVIMNGKPQLACLIPLLKADGAEILTIEGMAPEERLHPLQQAFWEEGAVQCGYCTPGMLLSAKALRDENPEPGVMEVKKAISGNLSRCTGYTKIIEATLAAAEKMRKRRLDSGLHRNDRHESRGQQAKETEQEVPE